ncbi:ABC transporter substrate-binding protein [Mongoliitalea daihaiensis]|uniref:ABC transporter substrate-binding protein n=1 Tax=Mongoliitalea daihaiensis TaxID=2782006 RepID=UPI001F2722AC|nr:ABC transporter substrate-binding protein [Mongoliitalea daihaiensis]UJP66355.1 ABC transporter substrate-binding protein [Mongoliitalea daihaiensis]
MKKFILALDWTANTNHSGFFVAAQQGFYAQEGLDVHLRSTSEDNYARTPASLLAAKEVHLAMAPSESVIAYRANPEKPALMAIAAVLQRDASAIVCLKSSGLDRISQLDGKEYASYNARFEDHIVAEMIKTDGGKGEHIKIVPEKLGIWNTLLEGKAAATWVFMPWEGVMANKKQVELNAFYLKDYKIPYGYSPVLLAHPELLAEDPETYKKFLRASKKGFQLLKENPQLAVDALYKQEDLAELADKDFLINSQVAINPYYFDEAGDWGLMQEERWTEFIHWLKSKELITAEELTNLMKEPIFTNFYLSN